MKDINCDLISIIIPVYNVEKYLKNCLDSILNQTYKNIEIILIDDGSTDNSSKICDAYLEKDNRIKVFHKENGGLSSTRNYGIEKVNGKYITFVDSDDDIESDYIDYLYNLIIKYNTKISICPYNIITKNNIIDCGINKLEKKMTTEECLDNMLCENGFTISACSKLYLLELFKDIRFPVNKLCEDNGTTYKLVMKCDNIAYGNKSKYNYYKRYNSIMTSDFSERRFDLLELVDVMCADIIQVYPQLIDAVNEKKINSRFSILRQLVNSDNELKYKEIEQEIIRFLKLNYKNIMKSSRSNKRDKIAIILLMIHKNIFKLGWNLYSKNK